MKYLTVILGILLSLMFISTVSATGNSTGDVEITSFTQDTFSGLSGDDFSSQFIVKNNGADAMSLSFIVENQNNLQFQFNPNSLTLQPNESSTINLNIFSDNTIIGNFTPKIIAFEDSSNQDFFTVNVNLQDSSSKLTIDEVEVENEIIKEGGIFKSTKPLETISIEVKVRNLFQNSADPFIDDIEVELIVKDLEDDSTDDLNIDANEFSLEPRETQTINDDFRFKIPFDVENDRIYDFKIIVRGRDDKGLQHRAEFSGGIHVKKDPHDVRFTKLNVPTNIKCGEVFSVDVEVANLGSSEEDDASYSVWSKELNIGFREYFKLSDSPGSSRYSYGNLHTATIPKDIVPGKYTFLARTFYDRTKEVSSEKYIVRIECPKEEIIEETKVEEPEEKIIEEPKEEVIEEPKEPITIPTGKIESIDQDLFSNPGVKLLFLVVIISIAGLSIYGLYRILMK